MLKTETENNKKKYIMKGKKKTTQIISYFLGMYKCKIKDWSITYRHVNKIYCTNK